MSDKVKERIEKEAKEYCHTRGEENCYIRGATSERPKAWNEAIDECRHEVALWLTDPEKLGSALMDKLESLKHK